MSEFDSEADRRDSARANAVIHCVTEVQRIIEQYAVTKTKHERTYLQFAVIQQLMRGLRLDAWSLLMREEIATAGQIIEEQDAGTENKR